MFSSEGDLTKNDLLKDVVPTYRSATQDELKICPGDWKHGSFFTTLVIDSESHLKYLRAKVDGRVKIYQARVKDLKELGNYDCIFNCTGLGAKWLCGDDKVVPIRGQVYKVKAPWIKMFFYSNSDTYVIPGMNYVTLGGTRQFDNYNLQVDPHDSAGIWERATQLLPNLKRSDIVREWVGLRPYRDGGVRSELEIIKDGSKQIKVIHNYGHGGYGVTFAPGSCKHSVKTFTESHRGGGIWKLWRSKF
jgi:D-aspartate oxidase